MSEKYGRGPGLSVLGFVDYLSFQLRPAIPSGLDPQKMRSAKGDAMPVSEIASSIWIDLKI